MVPRIGAAGAALALATMISPAMAQPSPAPAETMDATARRAFLDPVPPAERTWFDCTYDSAWLAAQCRGLRDAWYERRPLLLVSGYAWHDPATYKQENLDSFNSKAWGGGLGLGSNDEATGDHYAWYAFFFRDSNRDITSMAGWAWITYWPDKADVAAGLGYTVFVMQRPDIFEGIPFPAALPLASVKLRRAELLGTFIPKLNSGVNHGNVGYLFGRYQF